METPGLAVTVPCQLRQTPTQKVKTKGTLEVLPRMLTFASPGAAKTVIPLNTIQKLFVSTGKLAKLKICTGGSAPSAPGYVLAFFNPTWTGIDPASRDRAHAAVAAKLAALGDSVLPPAAVAAPAAAKPSKDLTDIVFDTKLQEAVLSKNPTVALAFKQTVEEGVVTPEEFWRQRRQLLVDEKLLAPALGFPLSNLSKRKQSDSTTTVTIDAFSIEKIFRESPAIAKAYRQLVPTKYTEVQFWKKYYRSKYYHKGKSDTLSGLASVDLTTNAEIAANNEELQQFEPDPAETARRRRAMAQAVDPSVDLTRTAAERLRWRENGANGYGSTESGAAYEPEPDYKTTVSTKPLSAAAILLRRKQQKQVDTASVVNQTNQFAERVVQRLGPGQPVTKVPTLGSRGVLTDEAPLADLQGEEEPRVVRLQITNRDLYFRSAAELTLSPEERARRQEEQREMALQLQGLLLGGVGAAWPVKEIAAQSLAASAHKLQQENVEQASKEANAAPPEGAEPLEAMQLKANELLRHFWSALQVRGSRKRATKLLQDAQMHLQTLENYQMSLHTDSAVVLGPVIERMKLPLTAAISKFKELDDKRRSRKRKRATED